MSLKVGVAGLRRGNSYVKVFAHHKDSEIVAVCDTAEGRAQSYAKQNNIPYAYQDYYEFLKHDMDVVAVCTPAPCHAENVIDALESGKHVLSEVPAAWSLEECKKIVQTVEKTNLKYMMAENCCYYGYIDTWKQMIDAGRLGKIIYAEAEYVHDCRSLMKDRDEIGKLTWRASMPPIHYCTHSLGPLLHLMNDRCVSAVGFNTGCNVAPGLGAIDMEVGLFKTEKGAVIKILCGFSIAREPSILWYVIYGTKGVVENNRCGWDKPKGYFEDVPNLHDMITYPITPSHTKVPPEATLGGHGTSEYFLVKGYIESILNDASPPIDVYRAMDYSAPGICAHLSAESGGKLIEVPDYRSLSLK